MGLSTVDWLKIIAFILELIIKGMPKADAVSAASVKFGVSSSDIWKHGGF